ncbi:MAG: hypothetical protein JWN06_2351 [Propionibacteriaceae bacterium]|jgi:hypothetical protein|nr:hypothetical protein [Propionibacteriaceae bacterium]
MTAAGVALLGCAHSLHQRLHALLEGGEGRKRGAGPNGVEGTLADGLPVHRKRNV